MTKHPKRIDGYFAETLYPSLFHAQFAPPWIDAVLRRQGVEPPRGPGRAPFRVADLGCGDGMGLILLAAAYPEGDFVGIDAMPAHITAAKRAAKRFGLANIAFHCTTFDQACARAFAPFDYIGAQGVIAWVSLAARTSVYDFAATHLGPHGVLTLGYNTMPGWSEAVPMQRLLWALGATAQGTPAARFDAALARLKAHIAVGGQGVPLARVEALEAMRKDLPADYFPHEYFNENWQPLWSGDVIAPLAARGLDFAGLAMFATARDDFCLRKAQRQALANVRDVPAREMLRDSFLNTSFRIDCFARAPRPADDNGRMQGWLAATVTVDEANYELKTAAGTLRFDNAAARAILAALANGPKRLCDCADYGSADMLNAADALLAAGLILPADPPQALSSAADALNAAIVERRKRPDIAARIGLHGVVRVSSMKKGQGAPSADALRRAGLTE